MKKNVIIFSASTGLGHNQVANTLKHELALQGYEVTIIEPFKEKNGYLDGFVSDGYKVLATHAPKMYGRIYSISNKSMMNKSISRYTRHILETRLEEIIDRYEPELIICTHALFVKLISYMKRMKSFKGRILSVITDYIPHEFYVSQEVDAYLVGSKYTKASLELKGIPGDRIHVLGIPIKRAFLECQNDFKKSYKFTILLMGGSMGVVGIKKAFKKLLSSPYMTKIYVVCGNNRNLKKSLEKYESNIHEVEIFGFTDKIPQLMEVSDVIITKPGGLTVTESLAKNIPMIIPYYIPGQEQENAEILIEAGAAIYVESSKRLLNTVVAMIENPKQIEELRINMQKIASDYSLDAAVQLCMNVYDGTNKVVEVKNA